MALGLRVDDNDKPGADGTDKDLVWPATYNTFAPKEASIVVVFE